MDTQQSIIISVHIKDLILDPNNYRFIDHEHYKPVKEEEYASQRIQERTYNMLVGKKNENISDLINSFKSNGILKDPIQVKKVDNSDKYLVVEGNRRTATLKKLYSDFQSGIDVGRLDQRDFESIEVVLLSESTVQHLIIMGNHHIGGKKKWSPINQAQLIKDLRDVYMLSEEDVCNSLGITKHNLRRSLRTLSLVKRYKQSDFGDQFKPNMYSLFEEVIKNTKIKEWLGWNDSEKVPTNTSNEERIFAWMSQEEVYEIDEDDQNIQRLIIKEPIISKTLDIRELSKFIDDKKAVEHLEESRSITTAFALSDAVGQSRLQNAISNISKEINTLFQFRDHSSQEEETEILKLKQKFERVLPSNDTNVLSNTINVVPIFDKTGCQFGSLSISKYKKLQNVSIESIGKVNIIVGDNNSGKTSLLEALVLQTNLNNINSLLEIERIRGNFGQEMPAEWVDKMLDQKIEISSTFNSKTCELNYLFENSQDYIDKNNYLTSILCNATVDSEKLGSKMHLYSNKPPILNYQSVKKLCNVALSSPFRHTPNLLDRAHYSAVEKRYLSKIISFIKENIDPSFQKIDLTSIENHKRFLVTTSDHMTIDLNQYGEGVQRVFEIGLLIGYCQNGVLCIDEVDSAIHKSLLVAFTKYIQEMADEFNTQIFLTTHSKECIDAFVQNGYPDDDLMAYALNKEDDNIVSKCIKGNDLKSLVKYIDIDIR